MTPMRFRGFFKLFFVLLVLGQAVAGGVACAYDITVIKSDDISLYNDALEGFKSSCGCNVHVIDLASNNGGNVLNDIMDSSPDAVVVIGSGAYRAVKLLKSVPIFTMLVYPYDSARENNVWWISTDMQPLKYLSVLTEALPHVSRIGLLFNPALSGAYSSELARAGRERGLQFFMKEVLSVKDVPAALSSLSGKIDLLLMVPDTTVASADSVASMVAFSYRNTVPIMTFSRKFLDMGSLISLEIEPFDIGRQAGELALALLREGGHTKTRGFSYARKAVLTVNQKIAMKLGIRIPERVLKNSEVLR